MILNIIFDFGGVLVDWNPKYVYKDYFNDDQKMEWFLNEICTPAWNGEQDRGRTMAEGTAWLLARHPEYSEAIKLYYDKWETMLKDAIPGMENLIKRLKMSGLKLYGLTNWSAENIHIAYDRFPVFNYFDGIVVSGEEKLLKPDKRLYFRLLDRYHLRASECVFIDDNPLNVSAAESIGIKGIVFHDADTLELELKQIIA